MSLQRCIEDRTARVAVIGQGYVGLPLANLLRWSDAVVILTDHVRL